MEDHDSRTVAEAGLQICLVMEMTEIITQIVTALQTEKNLVAQVEVKEQTVTHMSYTNLKAEWGRLALFSMQDQISLQITM